MLALTSVGAFMTPLDGSIVAVALPAIGPSLHLSFSEALWIQASYLLVISALLIPFGRMADLRGRVRLYLLGVTLFGLASVAAALSPNGLALIGARCVQGVGGALLGATSAAIVTAVFPPRERGRALGINVMAVYLGLTVGPPLGGLLVTHGDWRWIFLVNVPIAILTLATGWGLLRAEDRDRRKRGGRSGPGRARPGPGRRRAPGSHPGRPVRAFDVLPLLGLGRPRVIGLLLLAAASLVAFIVVEDRVASPLLDLDLLRHNRLFAAANLAALLNYAAMYGVTVFTAVFLEVVQERSAARAGLILLVQPLLMASLSPFAGRLSDRVGSRLLTTSGQSLIAVGMVQLAFLPVEASLGRVVFALATVGVGMAAFSAPNTSAVMGSVERSQLGVASGFLGTMRFAGQGMSVAILGAIAASRLGAAGGRVIFSHTAIGHAAADEYHAGYHDAMLVGAGLALVGALVSLVREERGNGPAARGSSRTASGGDHAMNKGGFSWKRALGVTRQKQRISRAMGVPLTRSGRQRKIGRAVTGGGCLSASLPAAAFSRGAAGGCGRPRARSLDRPAGGRGRRGVVRRRVGPQARGVPGRPDRPPECRH